MGIMLLILLLMPFAGALGLALISEKWARPFALVSSLLTFAFTVWGAVVFWANPAADPDLFSFTWIETQSFKIDFILAGSGIGWLLLLLTNFAMPFIIQARSNTPLLNNNRFLGWMFFLQGALTGVFLAYDALLFYVFWEMALIPAYFMMMFWGGQEKVRVTIKFFIYTMGGSLLMLLAFIYIASLQPGQASFSWDAMYSTALSAKEQRYIFWALFIAFAIKTPIFPLHTWQPETYKNAPIQATMMFSGLMAKMGILGLIRWLVPLAPLALAEYRTEVVALASFGVVYGAVIAIRQTDLKFFFAYASMSHMALMAAGILSGTTDGIQGALIQSLAHGITTIGLFFIAAMIFRRTGSYDMRELGGIRIVAPRFSTAFFILLMASIALPFTSGFIGEIMLIYGVFAFNPYIAVLASLSLVLGAVYMLRMFRLTMLGPLTSASQGFADLSASEKWMVYPLLAATILLGVFYTPFLELTEPSVQFILNYTLNR